MASPNLSSAAPSVAEIESFVASTYGLDARAKPLVGEVDHNFLIIPAEGERKILKVVATGADPQRIALQHSVLEYLATVDLPFAIPRPIAPLSDKNLAPSAEPPDKNLAPFRGGRWARMLSFVPGTMWVSHVTETPGSEPARTHRERLNHLGACLAHLDRALEHFEPGDDLAEAASAGRRWDLTQALQHRDALLAVPEAERRRRLEEVFHRFAAIVRPELATLPRQILHGDANDHNLMVSDDGRRVAGLIDFGDLAMGPRVVEIAIALAYALLGEDDPLAIAGELVAGYHAVAPLEPRELALVLPLAAARLAVSVTIAAERRAAGRTEPYLYVTEAPAWAALDRLAEITPERARRALCLACDLDPGPEPPSPQTLRGERHRRIGPNLSVAYSQPLEIVRGRGQYLFDHRGRPFLDLVNNVCHVGHCHPRVVEAAQHQLAILNTNTRYLYPQLTDYAERLAATLPNPLEVCFFVCSGSEANELALRLARTHTGRHPLLVHEGAYHGHTGTLIDISPYKFLGRGGRGEPLPWVHMVPMPDGYRGLHRGNGAEVGAAYGEEVRRVLADAPEPVAAFIAEPILGCGGQVVPPPGYLEAAYAHVRATGALCVADEVQVGFGRMGSHFWSFASQGVVPDIVVLGKPIGNGHPMAAVVTTAEIAASFANGMEFFSTFGGNPVSCAIGMAVLDVIEEEGLQRRAAELGERMMSGFRRLGDKYPLIGEVRGRGLFIGVELVHDHDTLEPATTEAARVIEAMKERGILVSTDGPLNNVLKIKPPMVLDAGDVDFVVRSLDDVLSQLD